MTFSLVIVGFLLVGALSKHVDRCVSLNVKPSQFALRDILAK